MLRAQRSGGGGGTGDDVTDARVKALTAMHSQKTRALMKSIGNLRSKVEELKQENRSSRRTATIQHLRKQVRNQELVVRVLKDRLIQLTEMDEDAVNEHVKKKTVGGPKRFRPKTREELQLEVAKLSRQLAVSVKKAAGQRAGSGSAGIAAPASPPRGRGARGAGRRRSPSPKRGQFSGTKAQQQAQLVQALENELEQLRVELDTRDRGAGVRDERDGKLRAELRELRPVAVPRNT